MNLFRLKDVNSTSRIFNERALALASWALACVAVFFNGNHSRGSRRPGAIQWERVGGKYLRTSLVTLSRGIRASYISS
jgi:hypothetical protein